MAKAFRFRLETVRRLREQARDRQTREVSAAVREVTAAESAKAMLDERMDESLEQARNVLRQVVLDVAAIKASCAHQGWLNDKLAGVAAELSTRTLTLNQERKKLAETSARHKAIEKLRERQLRRHQAQVQRKEQFEQDEVAARICSIAAQSRTD